MEALMFSNPSRPNTNPKRRHTSLSLASVALAAMGALLLASSASAASTACPATTTSTPFSSWGDTNSYSLVPGGNFESSPTGWTLSGAAARVAGSDPFAITGTLGSWALGLPAGSSAQSPFVCVEGTERTYRFVAHSQGAEAIVEPELVYETTLGNVTLLGKPTVVKSGWEPSPILHTGALLVTAITGQNAHLALRFTTLAGKAVIDDVYLDPRMRR
jgi:hypothetical protein